MESSSIKFYVAGALLIGALYYAFFRDKGDKSSKAPTVSHNTPARTEILPSSANEIQSVTPKELILAKKRATAEIFAGLKRIAAKVHEKSLDIQVRTKTDGSTCKVGDFDQIKSLTQDANEKMFLLTVESMDKKSERPLVAPLSIAQITQGNPYTVQLPRNDELHYYGIFLCSARKDAKGCASKSMTSRKEWRAAARGKHIGDRILHFQLIAVRNHEVFLLPSDQWDKTTLSGLQKILSGEAGKLQAALLRMHTLMGGLGSLGAGVRGPTVELNLPYLGYQCR